MNNITNQVHSILQCNARSLYHSKLTEFKIKLRNHNPSLVLLSETHWVDQFSVSFGSYDVFCRNRNANGGGVAILAKKYLSASFFRLPSFSSLEAVAIQFIPPNEPPLIIISVYCPSGNNTSPQEINTLLSLIGDRGLIAGDLNAHHSLLESHSVSNRCGNSIFRSLSDLNSVCLNTPKNLGTRMCPSSANISTIDLTFSSSSISSSIEVTPGPWTWNSDHRPLFVNLSLNLPHSSNLPPQLDFLY